MSLIHLRVRFRFGVFFCTAILELLFQGDRDRSFVKNLNKGKEIVSDTILVKSLELAL